MSTYATQQPLPSENPTPVSCLLSLPLVLLHMMRSTGGMDDIHGIVPRQLGKRWLGSYSTKTRQHKPVTRSEPNQAAISTCFPSPPPPPPVPPLGAGVEDPAGASYLAPPPPSTLLSIDGNNPSGCRQSRRSSSASLRICLACDACSYRGRPSPGTTGVSSSSCRRRRPWRARMICFSARSMVARNSAL
jgi:hypothetical protein